MTLAIDQQPVRILMILGPLDEPMLTWSPIMKRYEAHGCIRDFGHEEWYDGSPVGWDPCDTPGCTNPSHVRPVLRALIEDMP